MSVKSQKVVTWVVFAAEVLLVAYISFLFILLTALVPRARLYSGWIIILLLAGTYGLGTLWWMLLKYGPLMRKEPPAMNAVAWIGWAVGACLAISLIISFLREKSLLLTLQALAYFASPVALSLHLLIRYKRARTK